MFYVSEYGDGQALPIAVVVAQATPAVDPDDEFVTYMPSDYWFLGKTMHRRGHPLPGDAVNYALVWTAGDVSAPGVFKIADTPDDVLNKPTINQIESAMGIEVPAKSTLRETVRLIVRHYPEKFPQVPIGNAGIIRIVLGDLVDVFDQDDDPVTRVTHPYIGTPPEGTKRDNP